MPEKDAATVFNPQGGGSRTFRNVGTHNRRHGMHPRR